MKFLRIRTKRQLSVGLCAVTGFLCALVYHGYTFTTGRSSLPGTLTVESAGPGTPTVESAGLALQQEVEYKNTDKPHPKPTTKGLANNQKSEPEPDHFPPTRGQYGTRDGEFVRYFRKIKDKEAYMYSAMRKMRNLNLNKTEIVVLVQDSNKGTQLYHCCSFSPRQTIKSRVIGVGKEWAGNATYIPVHFVCSFERENKPRYISLTNNTCSDDLNDYLEVEYPEVQKGKLAICLHALHTKVNEQTMVEWFEYQRIMGTDKVFVFVLDPNHRALNLLAYYQNMGFVEIMLYELPGTLQHLPDRHLNAHIKRDRSQFFMDTLFEASHCFEKLSRYSYSGIFDLDELLVPQHGMRYKELMKNLTSTYPTKGSFMFAAEMFPVDWPGEVTSETIAFLRYQNKTAPRPYAEGPKSIHLPNRTTFVHVHNAEPAWARLAVPPQIATMHHYRRCKGQTRCPYPPKARDTLLLKYRQEWQTGIDSIPKRLWT